MTAPQTSLDFRVIDDEVQPELELDRVAGQRPGDAVGGPVDHAVAVSRVVLEPLRDFGLLSGGEPCEEYPSRKRRPWLITPLFDAAISFDLEEHAEADADSLHGRRHLRLVPDPAVGGPEDEATGDVETAAAGRVDAASAPTWVATLLVTLKGVEPPVWRRLEVAADASFDELHRYINTAMGWLDCHLHEFEAGRRRIAAHDADWESQWPHEDEERVRLTDVLADGVSSFLYRYDFGDDWEHRVDVERVGPPAPGAFYPRCVEAEGACPPEDCGGPHGYLELLEALAHPEAAEHADLLQWLEEPLDPGHVDLDGINRLLRLAATREIRQEDLEYFSEE